MLVIPLFFVGARTSGKIEPPFTSIPQRYRGKGQGGEKRSRNIVENEKLCMLSRNNGLSGEE
jgi:hypothetical protein